MPIHLTSRRSFIKKASLLSAASFLPLEKLFAMTMTGPQNPEVYIFSKHLQFLDYKEMAKVAAELGFDGVDLTVRPGGHVLPERVSEDLPKVVAAINEAGLKNELITTAIDDADDIVDQNVLKAAAEAGVKFYRMNWLKYENEKIARSLPVFQEKIRKLALLNEEIGIVGCYQNHAGELAGASLWELWEMLKLAESRFMGIQYDIRHATVEGGLSWKNGLNLVRDKIKTIVVKDFKWELVNGSWQITNTPIGEGMVNFKAYFKMLKEWSIDVPITLHLEYPLGGAEHGNKEITCSPEVVFEAAQKDLKKVRKLWQEA